MSLVEITSDGPIARLELNRPEQRNALSVELCDAIVAALEAIDKDPAARVVIINGRGKVFCSGADFAAVSGGEGMVFISHFERMLESVARFRLPTIAQIHGAALGGGLQLATVCDFRITADEATLGIPSTKLGIVVNLENVRRQVLLTGPAVAREVLMTARTFSGDDAVGAGLVNRSVPAADLATEARRWADDIVSLAPLSVQGAKRAIQVVIDSTGDARVQAPEDGAEIDLLVEEAYSSADLAEGLRALKEKRPPNFKGL